MTRLRNKGFTLVELLVVIAIVGVLAVAVLAAIDPIEQLKNARDTKKFAGIKELQAGLERYYANYQAWPWGVTVPAQDCPNFTVAGGGATGCTATFALDDVGDADTADLSVLVDRNELRQEYATRDDLNSMAVTYDSTNEVVRVCFAPTSQAHAGKATYLITGQDGTGGTTLCPDYDVDPALGMNCFVCVP